jgi:hypothetical protein
MSTRGVIYLASGGRSYLGELLTSLESLRRHEPDLPVTVFSEFSLPRSAKCDHVLYQSPEHPLKQKVLVLPQSPYEHTLFLDTDTTVLAPIQPIYDLLQQHDFAVANMFLADWSVSPPRLLELVKPNDFNTGVLLYNRSDAARTFLRKWADAVLQQDPRDMWAGHNCDQDYFNKIFKLGAMEECGVRFTALPNTLWNVRGLMVDEMKRRGIWNAACILHHRTRRMKLRKAIYSVSDPQTAREIALKVFNKLTGNRFLKATVRTED